MLVAPGPRIFAREHHVRVHPRRELGPVETRGARRVEHAIRIGVQHRQVKREARHLGAHRGRRRVRAERVVDDIGGLVETKEDRARAIGSLERSVVACGLVRAAQRALELDLLVTFDRREVVRLVVENGLEATEKESEHQ